MSYDISMVIDTGGPEHACVCDVGNMTSNVSPMWTKALGFPLADMHGWSGSKAIPHLEQALKNIKDPQTRHEYVAMNPENGWGSVGSAEDYLSALLVACGKHSNATIYIDR